MAKIIQVSTYRNRKFQRELQELVKDVDMQIEEAFTCGVCDEFDEITPEQGAEYRRLSLVKGGLE